MKMAVRNMKAVSASVSVLLATMCIVFALSSPAIADPASSTASGDTGVQKVTIADLSSDREKLTGKTVQFTGEVVGSMLNADNGHEWVLVSDDGNTVSVYMKDMHVEQLENFGAYGVEGDRVRITGVFRLECMIHDGDVDVHATEVKVLRKGGEVEEEPPPESLTVVIVIFALGILAGIVYWRLRERLR